MSVWTTRSLDRDHAYIVLQHTLKGVNHTVNGIKFRDGYAVVEKDSKIYLTLKRIPVLRAAKEYPLTYLRKLPFITRTSDIRTVYGQDVYAMFLKEEEKVKELEIQKQEDKREFELKQKLENDLKISEAREAKNEELAKQLEASAPVVINCSYRTLDQTLCKETALDYSPSNYCGKHITEEPNLADFGITKPNFMTKQERKDFREKVKTVLQKAKNKRKL